MRSELSRAPATGLPARIRRFALLWSGTPFHPQWFSFKAKTGARKRAAEVAAGIVLDIGCGQAALRTEVSANSRYVGLDYPATGKAWYGAEPDVFGDARSLPFADGSLNRILLLDVLEHLPEPERSLHEAFRVLAGDGRMLITIPCLYPLHDEPHDYQRFTEHGLRRRLAEAGFVDIRVEALGTPAETAALLFNIALAKWAADMVRVTPLALLLAWPLVVVIPLMNLAGRLAGVFAGEDRFMPYAYRVECAKSAVGEPVP